MIEKRRASGLPITREFRFPKNIRERRGEGDAGEFTIIPRRHIFPHRRGNMSALCITLASAETNFYVVAKFAWNLRRCPKHRKSHRRRCHCRHRVSMYRTAKLQDFDHGDASRADDSVERISRRRRGEDPRRTTKRIPARLVPRREEKRNEKGNGGKKKEEKGAINPPGSPASPPFLSNGSSHAVLLQTAATLQTARCEPTVRYRGDGEDSESEDRKRGGRKGKRGRRKISTLLCARGEFCDKNALEDLRPGETFVAITPHPHLAKAGREGDGAQRNEDEVHAHRPA